MLTFTFSGLCRSKGAWTKVFDVEGAEPDQQEPGDDDSDSQDSDGLFPGSSFVGLRDDKRAPFLHGFCPESFVAGYSAFMLCVLTHPQMVNLQRQMLGSDDPALQKRIADWKAARADQVLADAELGQG